MKRVVITNYVRTPIGAFLGTLKEIPVQNLASLAVKELVARAGIEGDKVDEIIMGHAISTPDASNLARYVALQSGLGEKVTGFSVNRICGSGLQALVCAAQEILCGMSEVVIAAGAESLSRVPYYLPLTARYQGFRNLNMTLYCSNEEFARNTAPKDIYPISSMGETAENIVRKYNISRQEQDEFSYWSQMKTKAAMENGRFEQEIVPVEIVKRDGTTIFSKDEHPRANTTMETLAKLKPAFNKDGSVTAGNSSGMNDGAAALLVMSEEKATELGLKPIAYVNTFAVTGVDPRLMGMGPVEAIDKVVKKEGISYDDIDVLEINEAFAGQVLGCMKEMGHYIGSKLYNKLNPNGGAVALGHPLGMSGARLAGTTALELRNTDKKYGIASACIGGGMGIAVVLENAGK